MPSKQVSVPSQSFFNRPQSKVENTLNPNAGQFKPASHSANGSTAERSSVVAFQSGDENPDIQALAEEVSGLKVAVANELGLIRHDVNVLLQGGWTVKVGPFCQVDELHGDHAADVRGRILDSLNAEEAKPLQIEGGLPDDKPYNHGQEMVLRTRESSEDGVNGDQTDDADLDLAKGPHFPGLPAPVKMQQADSTLNGAHPAVPPHKMVNGQSNTKPLVAKSPAVSLKAPSDAVPGRGLPPGHITDEKVRESEDAADPDTPIPSIEDPSLEKHGWKPLGVRRMVPLPTEQLVKIPSEGQMVTFSWEFLKEHFGGVPYSPGLYYIPHSHGASLLPRRTYYALDATFEPYLPGRAGAHGAKLTAFFNVNLAGVDGEEAAYESVPLFLTGMVTATSDAGRDAPEDASVTSGAATEYIYMGTYSQTRWSDKLDFDHMIENVPNAVKMFWAEQLSEEGRPEWVTRALMKHFWSMPEYDGALPGSAETGADRDEDAAVRVRKDVDGYVKELKEWKKDAKVKASLLTKDNILEAFDNEDAGDPPGLRLWWEYLQCVGWDEGFYQILLKLKAESSGREL